MRCYYGFATLDWSARGFDGPLIGVLWGLGIIGEIVLFAFAARIPAAIGPVALIVIGAGGAVLRWTLAALNPPVAVMVRCNCCTEHPSVQPTSAP